MTVSLFHYSKQTYLKGSAHLFPISDGDFNIHGTTDVISVLVASGDLSLASVDVASQGDGGLEQAADLGERDGGGVAFTLDEGGDSLTEVKVIVQLEGRL